MSPSIATKAELLALIERGPAGVAAIFGTNLHRVSIPEETDPDGGIWISLSPAPKYEIEDYGSALARIGGREVRLTKAEAREIRNVIVAAMRRRVPPRHSDVAGAGPRRRSPTRQSTRGASKGGKIRSLIGSTDSDAPENAA
jgi:hypothetical protein